MIWGVSPWRRADAVNSQLGQGLDLNGEFGASMFKDINSASLDCPAQRTAAQATGATAALNVTIKDSSKLTNFDYKVTFNDRTNLNKVTVLRSDGKAMGTSDLTTTPPPVIDGFTLAVTERRMCRRATASRSARPPTAPRKSAPC